MGGVTRDETASHALQSPNVNAIAFGSMCTCEKDAMKNIRTWPPVIAAALLVAACGGGDPYVPGSGSPSGAPTTKGSFTAVVSFGDSLSDAGTYTPATSVTGNGAPPYLGGKFTTNSASGTIWVEDLAASLGLVVTPAEVGFGTQSVKCPAAANPALANTCTAYGQGGARVTDPNGVRHTDPATGALRALTVPLKTQIANHLARFTSFKPTDLVLVWAGANDLLWEMETDPRINPHSYVIKLAQIQAQAAAGAITVDQAKGLAFQAQTESQEAMKQAALDLSAYIRDEILAKGAQYVAVLNLPDPASTPEGVATVAISPVVGGALTTFADTFNLWLREGLTGQPVQWVDAKAIFAGILSNPSTYGLVNTTVPACDAAKMSAITGGAVTDGFSLFCNATPGSPLNGLRAGADVDTWFFADGNHPTTGGYKALSDEFLKQLRGFGWI
jgi:outer membrane lipase/esterase